MCKESACFPCAVSSCLDSIILLSHLLPRLSPPCLKSSFSVLSGLFPPPRPPLVSFRLHTHIHTYTHVHTFSSLLVQDSRFLQHLIASGCSCLGLFRQLPPSHTGGVFGDGSTHCESCGNFIKIRGWDNNKKRKIEPPSPSEKKKKSV